MRKPKDGPVAVALSYDDTLPAPMIVAKGRHELAERIVRYAEEAGVPLVRDEDVADVVFDCDIGTLVPESMYKAVAAVLALVYRLDREKT